VLTTDLTGRRALVTGAGRGVGRVVALTLAEAGATVAVNDISGSAEGVVAEIRAEGGRAERCLFDVTDWARTSEAIGALGPTDILVNNAGNSGSDQFSLASFVDTQPEDWEPFLRINLYGVMHCTRAVLPAMIDQEWGRIITVVSDSGRTGDPKLAAYSAAKAGAAGLGRSLAKEVGRFGITVNAVALGTIAPPHHVDPERVAKLLRNYAIRRRGEPGDAAGLIAFLCSDSASWITGQTVPVNGGVSMAQ
jgi:NAD(P)-dependent dehydrogenase (short-subunit alcohol dehydrogenase family)